MVVRRRVRADIAEQLRRAIANAPISRYRLAKDAEVSEGVISHFMNGRRSLTLKTAARLAKAVGLELRKTRAKERSHGKRV